MTEQYIASLPSAKDKKSEVKLNSAVEIKSGNEEQEFAMKMEVPQGSAAVIVSGKMPYSFKNRLLASMSAQLISTRLLSEVRERKERYIAYIHKALRTDSQKCLLHIRLYSRLSLKRRPCA